MDILKEALQSSEDGTVQIVTFPLALFRQDFFTQSGSCMLISYQSAYLIAAADRHEKYFHVEYPDKDHNKEKLPKLWRKADFLQSYTNHKRRKYESEKYRQESYIYQQNRADLMYKIRKLTHFDVADLAFLDLISALMKDNTPEMFDLYGIKKRIFDEAKFRAEWETKHGKL